jgi:hypothetical protein
MEEELDHPFLLATQEVIEPLAGEEPEPEVVLEAVMLKHSRNRQWNERYFVFDSKHKLTYYDKKGDTRPKATFRVTRESGCEISDLYVNERQKGTKRETLYCFTITWPDDLNASISKKEISMHDSLDDMSYLGLTSAPPSPQPSTIKNTASILKTPLRKRSLSFEDPHLPQSQAASPFPTKSKARASGMRSCENSVASETSKSHRRNRSWFRKEKDPDLGASPMPHLEGDIHEVDDSAKRTKSRTPLSLHRRRATSNDVPLVVKMEIGPPPLASAYETIHEGEGGQEHDLLHALDESEQHGPKVNNRNDNTKGAYDDQHAIEQDKLHNLYISTKKEKQKESRKKMVEGTKIIAAAGAAITVGVLTVGVGLAAGLVFLGATAAAGGTAGLNGSDPKGDV